MRVLVVGSGGREHALAWKFAQSPRVQTVLVAPGNGGTARDKRMRNVAYADPRQLADLAASEGISFTVVGPEAPLAAGIVDEFRSRGQRIFGPTRAAAQLESSKDFAKAFMTRHAIPTAGYATFTDAASARAYVESRGAPIVIKADGLAAGKGVVVAETVAQAHAAIDALLGSGTPVGGEARLVIEDFLDGEEASFIVMCDGRHVLPLASSQDHKRLLDGDRGPNTGGMGAYSPAPVVTPTIHARVLREVILPTVQGMAAEGTPYSGFLYAGLMIDGKGQARVLEFNCRLGDPEAQPILMRLRTDLVDLVEHAIDGRLDAIEATWDRRTALGVVVAAHGYPDSPRSGDPIADVPPDAEDCVVFHAGTTLRGDQPVSSGGRVLCATALGDSVSAAQRRAYDAIGRIHLSGMQFRSDIGHRAVGRRTAARAAATEKTGEA
ncbi:MAG TPA: phosphoribosylamine--glycine ligase [Burkholderiaceae bacterium]|nr:phosphoribosylamine--glycine ligase [Burkholderiaceae bacterium]